MKNRILKIVAGVSATSAMIMGCFLDSASWVPTIAVAVLAFITLTTQVYIDDGEL